MNGGRLAIADIELTSYDKEMARIKKIRKTTKCYMCKKLLPKGSWCYGERWAKFCIDCQKDKYFPKTEKALKVILDNSIHQARELELNWDKYKRDNTLANLQHDE